VHHNREVTLKMQFTLTTVVSSGTEGGVPPTFGNRTVSTTIRLRDGETSLLAGLLREEERAAMSGIPGIMDIPALGKLFSSNETDITQTDIVLTLTPHIVRLPNITKMDLKPIWVGSESQFRLSRGENILEGRAALPFDESLPGEEKIRDVFGQSFSPSDLGIEYDETQGEGAEGAEGGSADQQGQSGSASDEAVPTAVITLDPVSSVQTSGNEFTVNVTIASAMNVGHVPFYITYDPAVLQALSCTEGPFMSADGASTQFLSDVTTPGQIVVGISRLGRETGAQGSGVLATILFRAAGPGQSNLDFQNASVRNPLNSALPSNFAGGSVTVEEGE
jgi:general secretion pathway protein D